jgi:hypothetical protein
MGTLSCVEWLRQKLFAHTQLSYPRRRVSSTPRLSVRSLAPLEYWITAFADDDSRRDDTTPQSRGSIRPRLAIEFPQPSRQRAQGMPGARCTRGLVCNRVIEAHTSIQGSGGIRHSLRNGLRLISCSPGRAGLVVTVAGGIASTGLTPASGRQDHTTSPYASAPFVKGTSASTASHPALVTIAKRPSYRDGTKAVYC